MRIVSTSLSIALLTLASLSSVCLAIVSFNVDDYTASTITTSVSMFRPDTYVCELAEEYPHLITESTENYIVNLEWDRGHGSYLYGEVCDVDNDGREELMLGNEAGMLFLVGYENGDYIDIWKANLTSSVLDIETNNIDDDTAIEMIVGTGDNHIYVFDGATCELEGDFVVPTSGWGAHYLPIATGDVDNDGVVEIITKDGYYYIQENEIIWHGYIHVFDGETYDQEYLGHDLGSDICSIALSDIDDDDSLEIVAGTGRWMGGNYSNGRIHTWMFNGSDYELEWESLDLEGVWGIGLEDIDDDNVVEITALSTNGTLYAFDGITKEEEWAGWDGKSGMTGSLDCTDVDGDDAIEIVVGWSSSLSVFDGLTKNKEWEAEDLGYLVRLLGVGDLDHDLSGEMACRNRDGVIYLFNGASKELEWKEEGGGEGISIEDIDDDEVLELVAGSSYSIYVLDYQSKEREWATNLGSLGWLDDSECTDIDDDGTIEVMALSWDGFVYVFDGVTKELEWKSEQMGDLGGSIYVENSLCTGDVDSDGTKDILVGTSTKHLHGEGGHIYIFDGVTKEREWVSDYLGDNSTSGGDFFGLEVCDADDDSIPEIVANVDNFIYVLDGINHTQEWRSPYLGYGGWGSNLVVSDIDNDFTKEIVSDGSGSIYVFDGQDHDLEWIGASLESSICGIAAENIDTIVGEEIIVGTSNGFIHIFDGISHSLEWRSDPLGCSIQDIVVVDITNDSRWEIIAGGIGFVYTFAVIPCNVSTAVYFNLTPNPATIGETVTLKGILIDETSRPLSSETVRLYARPMAGSWRYLTFLTTNSYGIFVRPATIPETPPGVYILAVYYPGSDTYQSCYNFAILIIQ